MPLTDIAGFLALESPHAAAFARALHARGVFTMAFLGVGPTELRLLLAAGAVALVDYAIVAPFGLPPVRLWDLGGVMGAAGMILAFIVTSARNVRALYREETRW